jgi:hypothetical protein
MKHKLEMKNPDSLNINHISMQRVNQTPRDTPRSITQQNRRRLEESGHYHLRFKSNESTSTLPSPLLQQTPQESEDTRNNNNSQAEEVDRPLSVSFAAPDGGGGGGGHHSASQQHSFVLDENNDNTNDDEETTTTTTRMSAAEPQLSNRFATMRRTMRVKGDHAAASRGRSRSHSIIATNNRVVGSGGGGGLGAGLKRSKRYRRLQMTVYNFLERPAGGLALAYQLIMYSSYLFIFFLK